MLSALRTRLIRMRTHWVALLLLCTLLQPMFVLACQAHESAHLIQTGHSHETDGHHDALPADERVPARGVTVLDVLLHQGHCCVLNAAIVECGPLQRVELTRIPPAAKAAASIRTIERTPMLRPPIRA